MFMIEEQKDLTAGMAQRNTKLTLKKNSLRRRSRARTVTRLEQLSSEIFFEIFEYLTGNEIHRSFFGLNKRIDQLIYNAPHVHLDLTQKRTRFARHFQRIFCEKNIVSITLEEFDIESLEKLFGATGAKQLKSISISDVSLYTSQNRLANLLGHFKDQLISLKVDFNRIQSFDGKNQIKETFVYLLTKLPLLKRLVLSDFDEMSFLEHMDSTLTNNNVKSLTLSVSDYSRWLPLLYRLPKLKSFTIHFNFRNDKKRVASRTSTSYFGCQIQQNIPADYRFVLRSIRIYGFNMILENFETLCRLFISPNLLTLSLFDCKRSFTSFSIPKRKPPFLDGIEWHDILKKYCPSTMRRFYVEYKDDDNIMSLRNLTQIRNDFIKYSGENAPWQVTCSYNQITKLLSFDLNVN